MLRKIAFPDAPSSWGVLFTEERRLRLNSIGEFSLDFCDSYPQADLLIERIGGARGTISAWGISNDVLQVLPDLEIISFVGLGVASFFDLAETSRRGITVTHGLSAASSVAEHTMALLLDAARSITLGDRDIRRGNFTGLPCFDLRGKTLGLVGFGRIARSVVPLAQAFGMNVIAWARKPNSETASKHGVEFVPIESLMKSSDIISMHLLLNTETEELISADLLRMTKPGVVIINTARQQILDEVTLIELLQSGHVGSFATDVFNEEPPPDDHPFKELDNVVMTPHNAFNTPDARAAMCDVAIENLEAYFTGNPQNVATIS